MRFISTNYPIRSLNTAPLRWQFVKDIYKEVGFQVKLGDIEKKQILEKLNFLSENELSSYTSKRFSKAICLHREKNGAFGCVEQLLDLPKVEKSHVQKICDKLKANAPPSLQEVDIDSRDKSLKSLFSKGLIPKPSIKQLETITNPTYVGVSLSLQGLAYNKMDSKRILHEWSLMAGVDNSSSLLSYQHDRLFKTSADIVNKIPNADYYLFEELLPILPKDPYMKHKVNLIKFRSMLITMLMMRSTGTGIVHTIKPNVINTLFNLKIGQERTSIHQCLDELITQHPFEITLPSSSREFYEECNSQGKEYLGGALLKCLAFDHLCHKAIDGFR